MNKLNVSYIQRKPSEILQLMLDRQLYTPEKEASNGVYSPFMCLAVKYTYRNGGISEQEKMETLKAVEGALKGEFLLQNYLEKKLGIPLESATNPRNKTLFYKGLIRRLQKAGN